MSTARATGVRTEQVGDRLYISGNTYPLREQLRHAGCRWDPQQRAWWIAARQAGALRDVLDEDDQDVQAVEDLDRRRVSARVEYQGRQYYQIDGDWSGGRRRLVSLDGTIDMWVPGHECSVIKTYEPREYRGRERHQTLGGLRAFVRRQADPTTRRAQCTECGHWGPFGEPCEECSGEGTHAW